MKPGSSKTNHSHPLVSIVKDPLTGLRCVLRYREPTTGKVTTRKLAGLNARQMVLAAKEKSRSLLNLRERLLTGEFLPNEHDVDVIQDWVEEIGIAPATKACRQTLAPMLRYAEEHVIGGSLTDITRNHLIEIKRLFVKKGNKRTTLNLKLGQLKSLLSTLAGKGSLKNAVSSDMISWELKPVRSRLIEDQTKSAEILNSPKLQAVFKAAITLNKPDLAATLACLFLLGCRKMELSSLNDTSVKQDVGDIPHLTLHASKTGRTRKIALDASPMLIHLIDALQNNRLPGDKLFNFQVGRMLRFCRSISKIVGFDFTPKQLRATCGAFLLKIGTPESLIARRLGHRESESLMSYRNGSEILKVSNPQATTLESAAELTNHFNQIYAQVMGLTVIPDNLHTAQSVKQTMRMTEVLADLKARHRKQVNPRETEEEAVAGAIELIESTGANPLELRIFHEGKPRPERKNP